MQLAAITSPAPAARPATGWAPLPELVGTRRAPWHDKTLIELTFDAAAQGVIARYDTNFDGRLDPRTESTTEDQWMYWANADGSQFSGYLPPKHMAMVRATRSIEDLLRAADTTGYERPVTATDIERVLRAYDTNRDGRLTWNDAGGGSDVSQFFGELVLQVGERTIDAQRVVSGA